MLFDPSLKASVKGYLENIAEIVTTYQNRVMFRCLCSESKFITRKSHTEYRKAVDNYSCVCQHRRFEAY